MADIDDIKELLREIVEHRKGERGTVIERHAQTIMVGLVTVGIIWVSSSVSNTNAEIQVLKVQNNSLSMQFADLKDLVTLNNRNLISRSEFDSHTRELERRLGRIEKHVQIDEQGWRSSP